jgi:hypothetical protein
MVTEHGYGMGIGGCNRWCSAATGHRLVALFFLFALIKDRSLHGPWKSHTYYPEHILAYGSGTACYSFVMGSGSSGPTGWRQG